MIDVAYALSLNVYEEGIGAVGYSFSSGKFIDDGADIYAKESSEGESSNFFFFSSKVNLNSVGKEQLSEFRCSESEEDYNSEVGLYERQGYCVLLDDEVVKLYVDSLNSEAVMFDWEIQTEEAVIGEVVDIDNDFKEGNEKGLIGEVEKENEEIEEEINIKEISDEIVGKISGDIAKKYEKNPSLLIGIVLIILIVVCFFIFDEIRRRKS